MFTTLVCDEDKKVCRQFNFVGFKKHNKHSTTTIFLPLLMKEKCRFTYIIIAILNMHCLDLCTNMIYNKSVLLRRFQNLAMFSLLHLGSALALCLASSFTISAVMTASSRSSRMPLARSTNDFTTTPSDRCSRFQSGLWSTSGATRRQLQ